ncbi:MAG: hypothetical protein IIA62_06005 [Nitrospinae bacterium]|nr:hypothetical protein [Nitrospinota bacterium]
MNSIPQDDENSDDNESLSNPISAEGHNQQAEGVMETEGAKPNESQDNLDELAAKYANHRVNPLIIASFVDSGLQALGQYCIEAKAGDLIDEEELTGDFRSRITLTDEEADTRLSVILAFPKSVACQIYQNIFGDVEIENVPGVVHELGNILAGLAKNQLSNLHSEIIKLVHPDKASENITLNFQTGLPEDGDDSFDFDLDGPNFALPLHLEFGDIVLQVYLHKI